MNLLLGSAILLAASASGILAGLVWVFIGGLRRPRKTFSAVKQPLRVGFVHPDFGIGGAENLVVNAMLAMQKKGVVVSMFTAHHDPSHCFEETRGDGLLADCVHVVGDWLPRNIFSKAHIVCTVLRMLYVTLVVVIKYRDRIDAFFVDQLSISIPFLRALGKPVFFYGHFPDKVQSNANGALLKEIYRVPFDFIEEITTVSADVVVANSKFSRSIWEATFPRAVARNFGVLYPPVDVKAYAEFTPTHGRDANMFVSLNRFERKKNVHLAIKALFQIKHKLSPAAFRNVKLVIAGGYDSNNPENLEHLQELIREVARCGLDGHVEFCTSVTDTMKKELLASARAAVYTPSYEHFGIVPVEAMALGTPVIAVNSGGPMETVKNGETGFLCESTAESFADAMLQLLGSENDARAAAMGIAGKERALTSFSFEAFSDQLMELVGQMFDGINQA
ncbi:putative alpha-1,3-mannosyltransferase [Phytophthora cinnamomi]|nr:putative alpha-1,3-mannosyltransferase [Phytophthora cinnamomi]